MRCLVVEDQPDIRADLAQALEAAGFLVDAVADGESAWYQGDVEDYDAVVLDLGLPDADGRTVIAELRGWTQLPVLVLSAREREEEKVAALDAGADDYLTKPFGVPELLARLRVLLRRRQQMTATGAPGHRVAFGEVAVDLATHEVRRGGQPVHLTPIEFRLLAALIAGQGRVLTHRQLLLQVWGPEYLDRPHYLRVHMANLRQKLEAQPVQPRHLLTELQVGYRLADVTAVGGG